MNKADFISLINTKLPDGANIPSTDHRDTMHTDANSIGEVVYGESIQETKLTESILTTNNADWNFSATIMKVGRQVTLIGRFKNESDFSAIPSINITDADYKCKEDVTFYGAGLLSLESVTAIVENITAPIALSRLRFSTILNAGEAINFNVTYASNI